MKNENYVIGCIITICSTFLAGISQVLLKYSSKKRYKSRIREYINVLVIMAYGIFALTTILSVIGLKYIPLSIGTVLGVTGQIFVPILSHYFLKEQISIRKMIGMGIIIIGVVIFPL